MDSSLEHRGSVPFYSLLQAAQARAQVRGQFPSQGTLYIQPHIPSTHWYKAKYPVAQEKRLRERGLPRYHPFSIGTQPSSKGEARTVTSARLHFLRLPTFPPSPMVGQRMPASSLAVSINTPPSPLDQTEPILGSEETHKLGEVDGDQG